MRPLWLAGLLLATAPAPLARAEAPDVTVLASSCATCHGPALEGAGAVPGLKGRRSADLATTLRAFQTGERPATIMTRLSKGWSEAEIDALAAKLGEAK
ncbi:MAG: c-type cytochrome [Pseudomonadota bacterium]